MPSVALAQRKTPALPALANATFSVGVGTVSAVGDASNGPEKFAVLLGLSSPIRVLPRVITISHEIMSVEGRNVPVAPFVVIVPEIVYPSWAAGWFTTS
jgi:hypothetical protein